MPTRHRIVGITNSSLDISGALLLRIEVAGKITRQMVHVSKNTQGLYLSEKAMLDLGLLPKDFPGVSKSHAAPEARESHSSSAAVSCDEGDVPCIERTPTPDIPDKLPFPATKENLPKFEEYFLSIFGSSAFNTCTHQPLQELSGAPMDIKFKDGAVQPAYVTTPIPVPHHWKEKVKADLDRDIRLGIIEKVPQGNMSQWCSRMVVVPKANGKPRRTVDLQKLNEATVREVHHTPSPINLVSTIPAGKVKTVLDAWNGYHSLELSEDSRDATTFITEWGRLRYCRGPQGFHGTGDAYTRRFDDITAGETRYVRCIDVGDTGGCREVFDG